MKTNSQRGFTLIELLVVIAIIGMLAAVVLASLNSARSKGADAAVKSSLNNARAQAEIYYDSQTPNTYANVCTAAGGIQANVTAANNTNGAGAAACNSDANEWAAYAALTTGFYCIDYKGNATTTAASTYGTTDGDRDCD